ncbi:MAG: hypothetical protein F6J93_04880 [Oscillatoria sp. SIO1A7]|nr:hypothetical protein [Oscillatoria sp. SIO1A7]
MGIGHWAWEEAIGRFVSNPVNRPKISLRRTGVPPVRLGWYGGQAGRPSYGRLQIFSVGI